jgi:hypothetical protein
LLACGKFDGSNSNTWYLDTGASNHVWYEGSIC